MITYKLDSSKQYDEMIKHTLRSYNQQFTGAVAFEARYIYALKNDTVIGALMIRYFWDWATVGDVYYADLDVLKAMIQNAWQHFEKKAVGLMFFTPVKTRFNDFLKAGFKHIATIDDIGSSTYYHAQFDAKKQDTTASYPMVVNNEPIDRYQKVLDAHTPKFTQLHQIHGKSEDIQIVALQNNQFVGGVQGEVYTDTLYISRIAVLEANRHQAIGKTLMLKAIEEAKRRGLVVVECGTNDFQAKAFYEKLGFNAVLTRQNHPRGYNSHTMIKRL